MIEIYEARWRGPVVGMALVFAAGAAAAPALAVTEPAETSFNSTTHVCFDTDAEADKEMAIAEWAVSQSDWAGTEAENQIEACLAGFDEECSLYLEAGPDQNFAELPQEIIIDICEPGEEASEGCAMPMEEMQQVESDISMEALQRLLDLKQDADPERVASEGFGSKGAPDSVEMSRACVANPCGAPPEREQLQSIMGRPVTEIDWQRYQEAHAFHCLAPTILPVALQ